MGDSQRLRVSSSHFLPQGGAEMSQSAHQQACFVVSGSMLVRGRGEKYLLEPGDVL